MKNLFLLLQSLMIIFPIGIFFTYVIKGEGFTYEHYLVTAMSSIPFFLVLLIKYFLSGFDDDK
ncbi:hypothetical protein Nstercoris_00608 [Nitrosomonas stercoris]|uniref:Uncharacterized protein n=1 Tax=Nitrosomonas stercoris TaxID=1444684 RepID=A0A4Y1YNI5_9PROT|nr:hypothetical protein Nstercoris_00608 [Nitrosomonas stercoris]